MTVSHALVISALWLVVGAVLLPQEVDRRLQAALLAAADALFTLHEFLIYPWLPALIISIPTIAVAAWFLWDIRILTARARAAKQPPPADNGHAVGAAR